MEYEKLCLHHTLRRLCETCDLADQLDDAKKRIHSLEVENNYLREDVKFFREAKTNERKPLV